MQAFGSRAWTDTALALALARKNESDWAGAALQWLYAQVDCDEDLIHQRLTQYTLYRSARAGIHVRPDALAVAVGDAMAAVRYPHGKRRPPSIRKRALQIRMRSEAFGFMRREAEHLLMTVIRRGMWAYLRACGYGSSRRESFTPTDRQTLEHGPETNPA